MYITTEQGADVMYFSNSTQPSEVSHGPTLETPTLVVEVASPSNNTEELLRKAQDYLDSGVVVVWVIDPVGKVVRVIRSNGVRLLSGMDDLTEADVLPELNLTVHDVTNWPDSAD